MSVVLRDVQFASMSARKKDVDSSKKAIPQCIVGISSSSLAGHFGSGWRRIASRSPRPLMWNVCSRKLALPILSGTSETHA